MKRLLLAVPLLLLAGQAQAQEVELRVGPLVVDQPVGYTDLRNVELPGLEPLRPLVGITAVTGPEVYTINVNQTQAGRVDLGRIIHNEQSCNASGLALSCTQAELDAVGGTETIYVDTTQGRNNFLAFEWALPDFLSVLNEQSRWDTQKARINFCAASQADKDATCQSAGIGLGAGCNLYNCP